ncbi:DUF4179 domain-containing protein [Bacillus alkalicellulosilyticus]|uniref:DUF4179 domain-containing protein n=1 Tax=Alkalihalobacterium alkalicellulosilyticum TaxID=1912214 RepID=UPI000997F212|nr:DUF4179 domain-containing protein [Bacillus alkalicellulosilyticus]
MKDIYESLNDINIDESEIEEIEVSPLEKRKVKKALKRALQKKRTPQWKKTIVAASILGGLSMITLGLTFPTYASNLPFLSDIFAMFNSNDDEFYTNYKENASELNLVQESNGITITLKDAVYDGKSVTATFFIESETDLGETIYGIDMMLIKKVSSLTGYEEIKKIGENQYVGIVKTTIIDEIELKNPKVTWNINKIKNGDTMEAIDGQWSFSFSLEETNHTIQNVYQQTIKEGVKVQVERLTNTPMSTIVFFNYEADDKVQDLWDYVHVMIEMRDDLGNVYQGNPNGGMGIDHFNMSMSETFGRIDPAATKLIITPHVSYGHHTFSDENEVTRYEKDGVEFAQSETTVTEADAVNYEESILDEIIIELVK